MIPDPLLSKVPADKRSALESVLALDPRPSYHNDANRVYGMRFADLDLRFTVNGDVLTVTDINAVAF